MDPGQADRYLIDDIRSGNESSWRQLIDRFHGRLLAFARSRTASLSDSEDLVQETFIGFLNSLPNFDPSRSLETYLFTILRYKLVDRLRSKKITPLNIDSEDEDWWDRTLPTDQETPSQAAAAIEENAAMSQQLADLLRRLIHEYRDRSAFADLQVIELIFFGGKRNLEVSEALDMDQKQVAGIKFRAIAKLKSFLEEDGIDGAEKFTDEHAEITVARVWRQHRLTCLKRSTLGSYSLGVLEDPWLSYTQFHLDLVNCPMCLANLGDIEAEELEQDQPRLTQHLFTSSVGFLSKPSAS
ncbi:MAG TPA: sigma-70 family RNA polymerase sigma factor [Phycisphaerae bacterium]|nr:sigma-70 family RNA polymerase sigma factor [Phycisphaerae bacterium]